MSGPDAADRWAWSGSVRARTVDRSDGPPAHFGVSAKRVRVRLWPDEEVP